MTATTQSAPDFTAAARKALLVHPEKQSNSYSSDEVAEAISEYMEKGFPQTVVLLWGREFALTFLAVLDVEEGATVEKLHRAIESGPSFWDNLGEPEDFDLSTTDESVSGQRFAVLSLEAREAARTQPVSVEVLALREMLEDIYQLHGDKLPRAAFGDDYKGFGIDERPVCMKTWAEMLDAGVVGPVVHEMGRDFASLVADELPALQLFTLYALLSYAVKVCKTPYDNLGHLDYRSKELMLYA